MLSVKMIFSFPEMPFPVRAIFNVIPAKEKLQMMTKRLVGILFICVSTWGRSRPTRFMVCHKVQIAANIWNNRLVCNNNTHLLMEENILGVKIEKEMS